MRMSFRYRVYIVLILYCVLLFSCGSVARRAERLAVPFIVYPVEKVRTRELPHKSFNAKVSIAGNDHEAVLPGIRNGSDAVLPVNRVAVLQSPDSSLSVTLYRLLPYTVTTRTSLFPGRSVGEGDWPDALVPVELSGTAKPDAVACGVARSPGMNPELSAAFDPPIEVPPGESLSFLLDLYLPSDAPKTPEDLRVILSTDAGENFAYTIHVDPYPFTLPSTSSLRTAFGFTWPAVAGAHERLSSEPFDAAELHYEYLRVLSEHRISVYNPQLEPVTVTRGEDGRLAVDWTAFDETTGRLLDGTLFPGVPPATSFRFPPAQEGAASEDLSEYYRLAAEHLADRGWLDRAFFYLRDEPLRREYPTVRASAEAIKAAAPGVRTLATETFSRALAGYVDIWCPDTPNLGDSIPFIPLVFRDYKLYLDWQYNPNPSVYRGRKGKGEEYWYYNCMSARFWNYPNMFIDYPAAYQRVLPWLAYLYGMEGFLYWDTVYSMKQKKNPWDDQYQFMSNGDGNLLYPGVPGLHGLTRHTPVPSLRMVLLREGIEDMEYLKMLEKKAGYREARKLAGKIIWRSTDFETDMRKFHKVRNDIAEAISSVPDPAAVP